MEIITSSCVYRGKHHDFSLFTGIAVDSECRYRLHLRMHLANKAVKYSIVNFCVFVHTLQAMDTCTEKNLANLAGPTTTDTGLLGRSSPALQ